MIPRRAGRGESYRKGAQAHENPTGGDRDAPYAATRSVHDHPGNPRYFTDGSGKPAYLTGAHTWNNFQHNAAYPRVESEEYLDLLERHHHNFIRLWVWEQGAWDPWAKGQVFVEPAVFDPKDPSRFLLIRNSGTYEGTER